MQMFSTKTREWFLSSVGTPTEAQRMGWQAISEGRDALISSPTGSGKTLAAFLYFLDEMRRELDAGALAEGLRIVYVSPLKALGNDIRQNLERPLAGLGLSDAVRVAVRTGDTDAKARREMIKHPPHILITTPESLYLLLTSLSGRDMLKTARTVIVDELHAVLSSKRGAHLFLSLARLDALCGGHVRRVGLSATVNPPEEAARHLTGGEPCAVIVPKIEKRTELTVDVPVPDMRQLPERSVWPAIADRVIEALDHVRTVLVFVDGRAGCERLALRINERAGQTLARTHHGCVSKEQRLEAERMLKSGELRVMVATSSMELGVDVGEIDLVVQVGPPPGVSALLQRLGRAGHNPSRVSRMRVYPRTAAEAIGCALVCEAAREGRIERVRAPEMCLDVLSQHLVSMAAAGAYTVDEAVEILSRAYAYRRLASEDVKAVLGMLSGDYERMDDRPVKPRVVYDRLSGRVSGDAYTRMLALSAGGTIPDRGWFAVTLPDGTRLGELDEEFVFEARLGDKFYLGAFPWKIEEITRDRVIVSPTSPEGAASPFWKGDRAARAYETGAFYGSLLSKWEDAARRSPAALRAALCAAGLTPDAAENAARVLESQLRAVGCLATDRVLVAEHFSDEAGEHQLMLHSPFGDAVNRALGMLLARRAAAATGEDARAYDDDDGALICLVGGQPIPDALLPTLAATSAPDAYTPYPGPNPVSTISHATGSHFTSTNPDTAPSVSCASASASAAPGMRITSINPDTAPSVSCASANPNTAPDARFTSINPDTAPSVSCASANPNTAPDASFTSTNPDTAPSASCASASTNAASGARFASTTPDTTPGTSCASASTNAAPDARFTSIKPDTAPSVSCASANPNTAPDARFASANPDTTPGASCASANPNTTSGAHFTSINPDTTPGANCASASTNAAPDTCFTSTNPDTAPSVSCASASASAAPGMRITSINPDTKPGVNCASTNPNAASGAQLALDNPAAAPGAQLASADLNAALGSRLASVTPDATSVPLCGAAAEVQAMLPASPMFSMAFRYNVQRALLNGVRGGRRQPLWVQRLRGAEALGAAAAHPEHPMMRETLNECADGYLDLNALTRLLSAIRAGQVRVYEVHTDAPSPLCLNLRRQVEAEMMYDTAIPSAAVTLSKEALLTLAPTEEAVKSASRPARAPRSADELHARLLSEGDLLAGEACAPAEWMDALELAGRAVYIEPGLWIARENEDEYRLALEENDAAALSRVVRRTARFHGAQTAETLSERYAVDEVRAQEALNTLCSEGILREFGGTYVHAELYESAQRMTVALNRQRVETQPARAFARMLSQRVRGAGSSAAQLAQALVSLRGCTYPAAAWEGYLLPARVANYRPQLLDEALARGEAAYRVLPAERPQLPGETRAQAAARPCGAASSDARVSIDGSRLLGKTVVRDEAAERPRLPGETRAQASARPRGAAPSSARVSIDGSQLPSEATERDGATERSQFPGETRVQAATRMRGAAPSSTRVSIDGSRLPGETAVRDEAADYPQLSNETRAQAAARTRGAAPSGARISVDGSRLLGETAVRDEAAYRVLPAERPQLSGETRAQAAARPRGAAPSSARVSIDGSRLLGETVVRDEAAEHPQLSGEPRAQAATRTRGAAPSSARVSIDGSQLPGEATERDEAAERPRLPGETRAQAAARPRGAAPSGARVSIDGSWLPGEAAERPQLPGETRAQAAARPYGAAPSGARVSIDVSQFPGEAAVRDEAAYRVLPAERSRLPNETRAQAAARARDAAPSDARVSIDGSQLPGEAAVRDEAAYRVLPAERPQLPGETAVRVLSGERSQLSGETAARVQSGETADSRSIPAPEIDGVPANPLAASRVRGSAASAFELHAQRRGTAVLDQSGSAHPESGLRDGRAIFGERTRASRAASGERVRVQFDLPDDEGEYEPLPDDLTDMERDVLQTLTARGASFASRLPVNAGDALKSLLARGLVRADSFLPVREMLATESGNVKKTVRRRVRVMDAGRWSRVGVLPQTSAEALVERLFDRFGIVCRETAGADWNAAFGVLKHMEYAGKARRGYFVKGLSGAQFMRETDYSTITAQLRQPSGECVWLPAADPMQAWGAYLAHEEGRAFLRVPGAAVALMDGAVVAVSEKQGETLRVFDDPAAPEALRALADAFRRGAIFPTLPRLLIKKYPPTAAAHLEAAGFTREMLDYTLMRRG